MTEWLRHGSRRKDFGIFQRFTAAKIEVPRGLAVCQDCGTAGGLTAIHAGHGTRFRVDSCRNPADGRSNQLSTEPLIILLVDDDPDDRDLALDALNESGINHQLLTVSDGEELLEYLRREERYAPPALAPHPALVLLDMNMPRMDGREALAIMKADPALRASLWSCSRLPGPQKRWSVLTTSAPTPISASQSPSRNSSTALDSGNTGSRSSPRRHAEEAENGSATQPKKSPRNTRLAPNSTSGKAFP